MSWLGSHYHLVSYSSPLVNRAITPRLTIFVRFESNHYNAVYLYTNKLRELTEKLQNLPGFKAFYKKSQAKSESVTANGNTFVWGELLMDLYIEISF